MKIIALSDIHSKPIAGEQIEQAIRSSDLVILSGDITTFGGRSRAEAIIDCLYGLNDAVAGIIGNCDTSVVGDVLVERGISVAGKVRHHKDVYIVGVNGVEQRRFHGRFYPELINATQNISANEHLIVVSHQPCAGTIIANRAGYDAGSSGLRKFISEKKPMLAISGHIHEAFGEDKIGQTTLVNPGSYAEGRYAIIEINLEAKTVASVDFRTIY
jgi:uncharacterized protein